MTLIIALGEMPRYERPQIRKRAGREEGGPGREGGRQSARAGRMTVHDTGSSAVAFSYMPARGGAWRKKERLRQFIFGVFSVMC